MTIEQLLDAARERNGIASDNQLAKALGVSRQAVSSWRHGIKAPDPVACATLAGLTGEPLARVLGIVGEARAISREEKAVWRKLAATAILLVIAVVPLLNPAVAGSVNHSQAADITSNMHYAKLRKALHTLLRLVRAMVSRSPAGYAKWRNDGTSTLLA